MCFDNFIKIDYLQHLDKTHITIIENGNQCSLKLDKKSNKIIKFLKNQLKIDISIKNIKNGIIIDFNNIFIWAIAYNNILYFDYVTNKAEYSA